MLESSSKPKLLHIIPYDQFVPPRNGGALRCYHLCVELSKYYEVTLLTYQDKTTITDAHFLGIEVLNPVYNIKRQKDLVSKIEQALQYRWYQRSLKGPAEAAVLAFYPLIKKLTKTQEFDVVLMEHLSSMQLGKLIKKHFPKALRIIDQHNIDHLLFAQNHHLDNPANQKRFNHIKQQESLIYAYADYFLACSQQDVVGLVLLNNQKINGIVVPNGTEERQIDLKHKDFSKPHLLFCGSLDYEPNKNGLLWFFNNIWPVLKTKIKHIKLTVIGRNGHHEDYIPLKQDPQIEFIGEVEDVALYYQKSTIAIAPLLEGSGTRLKILEAMSFGVPVVSTTIGADGIEYTHNNDILIADTVEQFSDTITSSFETKSIYDIQQNALDLIQKKYLWPVIVKKLVDELMKLNKNEKTTFP
ncbi:glycosyltransferase family 4 protein [Paucihalobacter ruber]|uniref:Glycosyltransferase family 4 protein n=1 Tax=Paucihalobacter ruber TaxID=2567861 RepID=A0A506PR41_9FLAO|nr:glycosyltransferase family 4 protein [Paucihalobacter ruber]TPV35747.1 glycosyltransferase family 4 protein [Paucihalobacter ruber]